MFFASLKRLLTAPVFQDDEKTRVVQLLNNVILTGLFTLLLLVIVTLIATPDQSARLTIAAFLAVILLIALFLLRRGHVRLASVIYVVTLWLLFVALSFLRTGINTPGFTALILVIILTGLLLGFRAGLGMAVLSILAGGILVLGELKQVFPLFPQEHILFSLWINNSVLFVLAAVLFRVALRNITSTLARVRHSEAALLRVNRAYRVLSDSNQILIRAEDEHGLLNDVCTVIVEQGGYDFAWVGLIADDEASNLTPMAHAGQKPGYLEAVQLANPACDPTFTALREGQPRVVHHIHPSQCPVVAAYQWAAILSAPLIVTGQTLGVLSVYAVDCDALHEDEVALFVELANDLAFGLRTQRMQAAHRQMAQEVAEQHRLLRTLIDSVPDLIFLKDVAGHYTLVNQMYCQYQNLTADQIIGKTAYDIFPPELARFIHEIDLEHIRTGAPIVNLETEAIRRDTGEKRWLLMNQATLRNQEDEIIGLVGIGHDITERIQMEENLRYQAALLRNVSDAVVSTDLNLTILSWNPAAEQLYGLSAREAVGRSAIDLFSWADRETMSVEEMVREVLNTGVWKGDLTHTTPEGRVLAIQTAVSIIRDNQDTPVGLVSVSWDASAEKQAQEALLEQKRLQLELQQEKQLRETKGRFISMVSHEFRTPLTVIESSAEMIDRYWARMEAEKRQLHLQRIHSQVRRLDNLLNDFSLVLRAESGHLTVNLAIFDLELHCRKIVSEFEATLDEYHALRYQTAGLLHEIQADPVLTGYIVRNLLSNAIKYSPAGGAVTLSIRRTDAEILIQVADEGIGIPADSLDTLFEAYQRAGNVGQIRGTGLGLKIVKDCVELQGGHIEVTSTLDGGSTFTVTLPVR